MTKVSKKLSGLIRCALIPLLTIIVINSLVFLGMGFDTLKNTGYGMWALVGVIFVIVGGGYVIYIKGLSNTKKILILILLAFLVRLLWVLLVPSVPVSDYKTMYQCAKDVAIGNFSGMHGVAYFARYPHLTTTVMYMTLMNLLLGAGDIVAMKIVSLVLSTLNVFIIYKISKAFVKSDRVSLVAMLFASVFPPFVTYTSTLCTENLAMPLLLVSVLYFCKIINGNVNAKNTIICGVCLGVSNLFRGVGALIVVAMFIAMCLHSTKHRVKITAVIAVLMMVVMAIVSVPLKGAGIIQNHLWNGKESGITYFLKGLNIESKGAWSVEDATFVEEHLLDEDFNKQCIEIMKERLQSATPKELFVFFFQKFTNQWSYGDCNGTYWAFMDTNIKYRHPVDATSQLVGCAMLILSLISLFGKRSNTQVFLHLLLCGFGIFFLVFETQPRYAYITSWVFVLMAAHGMVVLNELVRRLKCLRKVN